MSILGKVDTLTKIFEQLFSIVILIGQSIKFSTSERGKSEWKDPENHIQI